MAYAVLAAGPDNCNNPLKVAKHLQNISKVGGITTVNVNEFAKGSAAILTGNDIDYQGASGNIEFDDNGDVTDAAYKLVRIIDGIETFITVLSP